MESDLRQSLERALAKSGPCSSDYDLNKDIALSGQRRLRDAGVLVGIVSRPDGPRIILTKRSPALRHHPGQISFPGGKVDPGDDGPVGAALREAMEEVALAHGQADIIGCLPTHETVTGFVVTPVLASVDPTFSPTPEEGEVAEVFEVPLAHVTAPASFLIESRMWQGRPRHYFTVPWGPYYIWGATARILRALADRMHDG